MSTALISSACTTGRRLTGLGLVLGLGVTGLAGTTATAADGPAPAVTQATDSAAAAGVEVTTTDSFATPRTLSIQTQTGAAGKAPSVQHTGDFRVLDATLPGKPGVLGLEWSGDAQPVAQARVLTDAGWQDWVDFETEAGENTSDAVVFSSSAREVEVRVESTVTNPRLSVISSETTSADEKVTSDLAASQALSSEVLTNGSLGTVTKPSGFFDSDKSYPVSGPIIASRQAWGAPEEDVTWIPKPSPGVRASVTHHVVSANDYERAEVPGIMRGINYWFIHGRDFGGFGYQAVTDRFGQAWQGREGPLADMPIGGHASGANTNAMGVSMMGTFTKVKPTKNQVGATALVAAWQLRSNDVDPYGTWEHYSKYLPGGGGTYDTIIPHMHLAVKDCPGYAFMEDWDSYKSTVRSFAKTDLMAVQPVTAEGANSLAQSVSHSKQAFPKSGANTETVYLSHWKDRATGVLTAQWAQRAGNPSLMVEKHNVLADTAAELQRLKAKKVVITSPVSEVSLQVEDQLRAMGLQVERVTTTGIDALGVESLDRGWGGTSAHYYVANAEGGYADLLSGGAAAIHDDAPMLMSDNRGLGQASLNKIGQTKPAKITLVGSTAVVPASVEAQIKKVSPGTKVERIGGSNRYTTAASVARESWGAGGANDVVLLGALDYSPSTPTALHVAAESDAPILFTKSGCMPAAVYDTVRHLNSKVSLLAGDADDTEFSAGTTRCS